MKKEIKQISKDFYTLEETKNIGELIFYRNDGLNIGNVYDIPIKMYHKYMLLYFSDIQFDIYDGIEYKVSTDDRYIIIISLAIKKLFKDSKTTPKMLIKSLLKSKK